MSCYHPLCMGRSGVEQVRNFRTQPPASPKSTMKLANHRGPTITMKPNPNAYLPNAQPHNVGHSRKLPKLSRTHLNNKAKFDEHNSPRYLNSTLVQLAAIAEPAENNSKLSASKITLEKSSESKRTCERLKNIQISAENYKSSKAANLASSLRRQRKELRCFYECSSLPFRSHLWPSSIFLHPNHGHHKKKVKTPEIDKSTISETMKNLNITKCLNKYLSESCTEGETESPGDTSSPGSDDPSKCPTAFSPSPLSTLDVRPSVQVKMGRNSPFGGGIGTLGRVSPCHDLGYHTLVTRQTPTPTRDRKSTPSPWPSEVRASPFPTGIDISTLSSCPRSSPRPQLPQVPPIQHSHSHSQQTPTPGINTIESTDQLLTTYKGKRTSKGSPFDRLSNELIIKVFSFLPSHSLCQAGRVCRKWYNLSWHSSLWKSVTLTGETLHVDRAVKQVFRLLARENGRCDHVEKIILNGCSRLTDRGLSIIGRRCPELRQLEIRGCINVSNTGIFELVTQCVSLENLDVTGCHNITCINLTPRGAIVEPDPLQSRQLYLQYLDMTDCYGLQDQGLKVIVKNCPQLLHLYLRRCINITDVGMKHLASYCLMLREVSISDCMQITDFGMYELAKLGPNLRYLSVAKCDQISDAGIKQIARHCYKIRYLNVRGCEAVSDDSMEMVARSCPRLRALDIGKCDVTDNGMKLISENCPNLKKLSVKSCDMITDLGIQYIAYYCRGLQQLNIQDCQVTIEGYRTVKRFCRRCIIEHTNPGFF